MLNRGSLALKVRYLTANAIASFNWSLTTA
jgi:hypothetical protein